MITTEYCIQEILDIIDEEDIIFVDGLSFTRDELNELFRDIPLRYYRSDIVDNRTHYMFTMCPVR